MGFPTTSPRSTHCSLASGMGGRQFLDGTGCCLCGVHALGSFFHGRSCCLIDAHLPVLCESSASNHLFCPCAPKLAVTTETVGAPCVKATTPSLPGTTTPVAPTSRWFVAQCCIGRLCGPVTGSCISVARCERECGMCLCVALLLRCYQWQCPPGRWSSTTGATSCSLCPAGTLVPPPFTLPVLWEKA